MHYVLQNWPSNDFVFGVRQSHLCIFGPLLVDSEVVFMYILFVK